jgi:F-type H+-transporting ATPase subunit gamma
MPNLKELTVKIASLKNTQKMTKTMKLVAASKMRRAQTARENAHEYAERFRAIMDGLAASDTSVSHPLLETRESPKRALILSIASDRGLCGGFNNNLCRQTLKWIEELQGMLEQVDVSTCGRRANAFLRTRAQVITYFDGVTDKPNYSDASRIGDDVMTRFIEGDYDAVYIGYNVFRSALSQVPTLEQLLPIENKTENQPAPHPYLFEPPEGELLRLLLPDSVKFRIFNALLENAAGEHAARMTAMESATSNAGDMIDDYTLLRNRERQAIITRELIEIVTGAESL